MVRSACTIQLLVALLISICSESLIVGGVARLERNRIITQVYLTVNPEKQQTTDAESASSKAIFANLNKCSDSNLQRQRWDTHQMNTFQKPNKNIPSMASLAFAEFRDWVERTVARNVDGNPFDFDLRQWQTSFNKWRARAVEADEVARTEFWLQYKRVLDIEMHHVTSKVGHTPVDAEDDWDSIYFDDIPAVSSTDETAQQSAIPLHTDEIIDYAVQGKWHVKYDESGDQSVDYQPW